MSNPLIPSRIQWNIPSNQCSSDTDSTISDLEALSISILEDDYAIQKKKGTVKEVNNIGFKEVTKELSDNFQKMRNSSPSVFENNTNLTEIVGESWKEIFGGSVRNNEENPNKGSLFTQSEDKTTGGAMSLDVRERWKKLENFEINSGLTEIIGRNWSENIDQIAQLEEIPNKKDEPISVASKQSNDKPSCLIDSLQRDEASFAEKWKKGMEKVTENVSELMFDKSQSNNQNKLNASCYRQCDVNVLKENVEFLNDQHKTVTSNEKIKLFVINTANLRNSDTIDLGGNKRDIDSRIVNCSALTANNAQKNPTQNSRTCSGGSTSNVKKTNSETMYGNVFYDIFRSIKNNETKENDAVRAESSGTRKYPKHRVFPDPLFSKTYGIPVEKVKAKRSGGLKNKNVNTRGAGQINSRDAECVPPKKKRTKGILKKEASLDSSERKKKKTKPVKQNLQEVKEAKVLVTIGARLDEIKTRVTKWLRGDEHVTVGRIDAINMLDSVRTAQADLTNMYRGREKKPAPAKKLFDAATILELQIGKAISDADLLCKTEELKRLQMLKNKKEGETDSDESTTSASNSSTSSHRIEVEKRALQQSKDHYAERRLGKGIIQSLSQLSFDEIPLDMYNSQVNSSNLKSILKNTYDHNCGEKKQLNFSDNVEYYEISQRPSKNVDKTMHVGLNDNIAMCNRDDDVTMDEDYDMLDEDALKYTTLGVSLVYNGNVRLHENSLETAPQSGRLQRDIPRSVNLGVSQVEKRDSLFGNKLECKTNFLKPESSNLENSNVNHTTLSVLKGNSPSQSVENPQSYFLKPVTTYSGAIKENQDISTVEYFSDKPHANVLNELKSLMSDNFNSNQHGSSTPKQNYVSKPVTMHSGVVKENQAISEAEYLSDKPHANVLNKLKSLMSDNSKQHGSSTTKQNYVSKPVTMHSVVVKENQAISEAEYLSDKPHANVLNELKSLISDNSNQHGSSIPKQNYVLNNKSKTNTSYSTNQQFTSAGPSCSNRNSFLPPKQNYFSNNKEKSSDLFSSRPKCKLGNSKENSSNDISETIVVSSSENDSRSSGISDSNQNSSSILKQNCFPNKNVDITSQSVNPASTCSGISDSNQNSSSILKQNYFPHKNLDLTSYSANSESISSGISDSNQNSSSILKQNYFPNKNVDITSQFANTASTSSGISDSNQNSLSILKQNYFPNKNVDLTSHFVNPESTSSGMSYSTQNNSSVLKQNDFLNNRLEQTNPFSSKSESMTSGVETNTSSMFSTPSSFSKFTMTETEESWHKISIMGVKKLRIKSESEYHKEEDDDGDWFSGWI